MTLLVKIFAAAVCLPSLLTARCVEGSCAASDVEISLLQVQQTVTQGSERAGTVPKDNDAHSQQLLATSVESQLMDGKSLMASEKHEDMNDFPFEDDLEGELGRMDANLFGEPGLGGPGAELGGPVGEISSSSLTPGQVDNAFEANFAKAKSEAINAAGHDFHQDRVLEKFNSPDRVLRTLARDQHDVAVKLFATDKKMNEAAARKAAVERAAFSKMQRAQEAYEANAMRQAQAETAAAEGRWAGAREGELDAEDRMYEWRRAQGRAAAQRMIASQQAAKHAAFNRARSAGVADANAADYGADFYTARYGPIGAPMGPPMGPPWRPVGRYGEPIGAAFGPYADRPY